MPRTARLSFHPERFRHVRQAMPLQKEIPAFAASPRRRLYKQHAALQRIPAHPERLKKFLPFPFGIFRSKITRYILRGSARVERGLAVAQHIHAHAFVTQHVRASPPAVRLVSSTSPTRRRAVFARDARFRPPGPAAGGSRRTAVAAADSSFSVAAREAPPKKRVPPLDG